MSASSAEENNSQPDTDLESVSLFIPSSIVSLNLLESLLTSITGRTKAEIEADRARNADTNKGLARNKTPTMELPEDEEGPDYWKIYAMQLKEQGTLDVEINHKLNRDWMFSHDLLKDYFVRLPLQPAFVPRRGEVVLFTLILEGTLQFNPKTKAFEMRTEDGRWLGQPDWRAGVVTQAAEEESSYLDIIQETPKKLPLSNSGFRVETLPHPLEDNKAWSLQYRYVPLKCIKPFSACHRWLFPTPREKWHPSIEHAMVSMASYTIVHNTRFKGTWPNAEIDCKGLFIGSELFTIKDTVRLKPLGLTLEDLESKGNPGQESHDLGATVTDVMVIERIFSKLEDCDADPNSDQLARKHVPMLAGKVYTRDPNRLNRVMPFSAEPLERLTTQDIDEAFDQAGMRLYGRWYRVSAGKTCIVSPGLVLGRCYEPEASQLHFGHFGFDFDIHNILQMRRYSLLTDSRIPEICDWFWAESRAEALGIATSNGIEVGPAAEQRDNPLRWQAILRILDGSVSKIDYRLADLDISIKGEGRSRAKKKFSEVSKTSKLVSTGLGAATENEDNGIDNGEGPYNLRDDDSSSSESDVSESKLIASIPLREPSEGPEYLP